MAGGPTVGAARARIRPARNRTRGVSNEGKRNLGRHVSALDPLADASHYGRHRPWDIEGRAVKHCAARPRGLPIRDARARRTAIGARHHAARRVVRGSHARHPHEGGTLRRDRQVQRRLLLRLDTLGAGRAWGRHPHPLGARTVESATGPAEIVDALPPREGGFLLFAVCRNSGARRLRDTESLYPGRFVTRIAKPPWDLPVSPAG